MRELSLTNKRQFKSAFTLIEILMVMAFFLILTVVALPFAISQLSTSKADAVTKDLKSGIFSIEVSAFTKEDNKSYGIAFFSDHYTYFTGNSLATSDTQENYPLNSDVTLTDINFNSTNELLFPAGSFRPQNAGSFKIQSSNLGYMIMVTGEGLILTSKL